MIYQPFYFTIEELVSKDALDKYGESRCWWLMDSRILKAADLLREEFGAMVVNDWSRGGKFNNSGFRLPKYDRYSMTSQHSHGRALDLKPKRVTVDEVRNAIIENRERYSMITGIEMGVSWVHIDCRNFDGLFKFYPKGAGVGRPVKGTKKKKLIKDLR